MVENENRVRELAYVAPNDVFATDLLINARRADRLVIRVLSTVATTFEARISGPGGSPSRIAKLNGGNNLLAGAWYTFHLDVEDQERVNFRFGANATVWLSARLRTYDQPG